MNVTDLAQLMTLATRGSNFVASYLEDEIEEFPLMGPAGLAYVQDIFDSMLRLLEDGD